MDRITASEVFIAIVEQGSMVAAAQALGMSRSMVTRYLAQMEDWANAQLIHRSTRRLSLTHAGEQVLERSREILALAQDIPLQTDVNTQTLSGTLRISCSQFIAQARLLKAIQSFQAQHPNVSIDLHISNQSVNLVEERIDLAIRITNDLDPNVIARPLGQCHSVLCAAPAYIQQQGHPINVEALSQHQCLIYANFGKHGLWRFKRGDDELAVPVTGKLSCNEAAVLLQACLQGMGISYQPLEAAKPYLDSGELIELLPDSQTLPMGIYGIYRSRKHQSPALRAFLDMLVENA